MGDQQEAKQALYSDEMLSGKYLWAVVFQDQQPRLLMGKKVQVASDRMTRSPLRLGHLSVTMGGPAAIAGEFKIAAGDVLMINQKSHVYGRRDIEAQPGTHLRNAAQDLILPCLKPPANGWKSVIIETPHGPPIKPKFIGDAVSHLDARDFDDFRFESDERIQAADSTVLVERLIEWLDLWSLSLNPDEGILWRGGTTVAQGGEPGIDGFVVAWWRRRASCGNSLIVAAAFLSGYWNHLRESREVSPETVETFIEAVGPLGIGSAAYWSVVESLYGLVALSGLARSHRKVILAREWILAQIPLLERAGTPPDHLSHLCDLASM